MKTVVTCPLGHTCEKVADGQIEVCAWYTKISGADPQTGKEVDESKCAIAWIPILSIEQSGVGRQVAESVQSLRNETIKRQDAALGVVRAKIANDR